MMPQRASEKPEECLLPFHVEKLSLHFEEKLHFEMQASEKFV
jgi:hypothetical protein